MIYQTSVVKLPFSNKKDFKAYPINIFEKILQGKNPLRRDLTLLDNSLLHIYEDYWFEGDKIKINIEDETDTTQIIEFKHCYFSTKIDFAIVKCESQIIFTDCLFSDEVNFIKGEFNKDILFIDCFITKQISFQGGKFSDINLKLSYDYQHTEAVIRIENCIFKSLHVDKNPHPIIIKEISIQVNNVKGLIQISRLKIRTLLITGRLEKDTELFISECNVLVFTIYDFFNNGTFRLNNIKSNNSTQSKMQITNRTQEKLLRLALKIKRFRQINDDDNDDDALSKLQSFYIEGEFKAENERTRSHIAKILPILKEKDYSNSQFNIVNSNLGKSIFTTFKLQTYKSVFIDSSYLTEILISHPNVFLREINLYPAGRILNTFERHINNNLSLSVFKFNIKKLYRGNQTIYSQLKYALGKQGDTIYEQKFHALEMRAYDKSLDWLSSEFFTKLIIRFSRHTSNFGQSLGKPFFWLILASLGFSIALSEMSLLPNLYHDAFHKSAWQGIGLGLQYIAQFANPLRKFEEPTLSGYWYFLDVMVRIWSSYMIYNIIRASRRFIK